MARTRVNINSRVRKRIEEGATPASSLTRGVVTPKRRLPARRQLVEAAQDERLPPVRMLDVIDAQIGQAAEQRVDRNLAFEAGELCPNAVMDAAAE